MSKFVGAIVGWAEIGIGIGTGQPWLVVSGSIAIATTALNLLLAPKAKAQQAQATSVQVGEVARSGIFGRGATAGSLVDAFNYGGKYGTDWTVLVIALADHLCDALEGFYATDTYTAFAGEGPVAGFNGQLEIYWRPGSWDQEVPAILTTHCPVVAGQPTWTPADRGRGSSYVVVAYKADAPDAKHPVWTAGQPQFLWVLRGARCYIARKDTSAGGAGTHRWSDPTTREWSENPIDCRYTWSRGLYAGDKVDQPEMLLLGRGLTDVEAPPANTFSPANACDEAVPLKAGGTEPRYRVGGVFGGEDAYIDTENALVAACGGMLVEREGAIEIVPGVAQPIVWDVSDADLLVGSTVTGSDFRSITDEAWCNTVSAKYVEPTQKWSDHSAPVRRVPADIIADGKPRVAEPSLSLATSGTQAQRVAEQMRRQGRLWYTRGLTLGPRFAGIEHGDWLRLTSSRYGRRGAAAGTPLILRVDSDAQDEKWQNTLQLTEIAADLYDWTAATDELADGAVAVQAAAPSYVSQPGAGSWAVAADPSGRLVVTGAVDDTSASAVLVEYRPAGAGDAAWTTAAMVPPATTSIALPSLVPGSYDVAVSYVVAGVPGDRLLLSGTVPAAAVAAIAPDTMLAVTGAAGSATIGWRNSTDSRLGWSVIYRGASADFSAAMAVSGHIVGALGDVMSATDTVAAGSWRYWVQAFGTDGTPASPAGPVQVTVS